MEIKRSGPQPSRKGPTEYFTGAVRREGGPIEEVRAGDVIWFPPGERHWHGATPASALTHIAIQETLDGKRLAGEGQRRARSAVLP